MKRLARRTVSVVIILVMFLGGMGLFLVRFVIDGKDWAAFRPNLHAYSYGVLIKGSVVDRNGVRLTWAEDGERYWIDSYDTRRAVLHVVGDEEGNIGTGLLTTYDTQLMGYDLLGGLYTVSNTGNVVHCSIDSSLCAAALRQLGYRNGAVAVYNYKTGDILCMVSTPGFDPLDAPSVEDTEGREEWDGVYLNRAMSSTFAPGSIFKIVTLEAAIETLPDLWDLRFTCNGSIEINGDVITCSDVHGTLDVNDALAQSCNVFFSELALRVGGENLYRYAEKNGLLERFEVSGIPVRAGSFEIADSGSANLAWSGIGQFNDLVNPLAAARMAGAIANGGSTASPRLVTSVTSQAGIPVRIVENHGSVRLFEKSTAETLKSMMKYDVTSYYNYWVTFGGLEVGGKSGTAETKEGETAHAWFIGFVDDPDYPLAFAVFVENGGWGLTVAGQIAANILKEAVSLKQ